MVAVHLALRTKSINIILPSPVLDTGYRARQISFYYKQIGAFEQELKARKEVSPQDEAVDTDFFTFAKYF
jgi:hypothetical protein